MKDLYTHIEIVPAIAPAMVTAGGNSAVIDLVDFRSVVVAINAGTATGLDDTNNLAFVLEHSDDGAAFAPANGEYDLLGAVPDESGVFHAIDSADKTGVVFKAGYIGNKRYIRLAYTAAGTVSVPLSAVIIKGHGANAPAITN